MKKLQQQFQVAYNFPVIFTRDVFNLANSALVEVLQAGDQKRCRVLVVIASSVLQANPGLPEKIEKYGSAHSAVLELINSPFIIRGGEICKKEPLEVEKIQALVDKHHLCRHSFILAIGGGAVLDAAGYAAATAHRGIRFIRMPTTTPSTTDSGAAA